CLTLSCGHAFDLVVSQRYQRVYPGRFPRGQIAGQEHQASHNEEHSDKGRRIGRLHPEQQVGYDGELSASPILLANSVSAAQALYIQLSKTHKFFALGIRQQYRAIWVFIINMSRQLDTVGERNVSIALSKIVSTLHNHILNFLM